MDIDAHNVGTEERWAVVFTTTAAGLRAYCLRPARHWLLATLPRWVAAVRLEWAGHGWYRIPSQSAAEHARLANTNLRYHWLLRRLTREGFTADERSSALVAAIQNASLGWLVDFVSSAVREHDEDRKGGAKPEGECLVQASAIESLRNHALNAIRAAAADGTLIAHRDVVSILFRWRALSGDTNEVREWTSARIREDEGLVALARDFTGQSWSMGMGGFGSLGDRVSRARVVAQIGDDIDIIDPVAFRSRLEDALAGDRLSQEQRQVAQTFLDAWDRKRTGREDDDE